MLYPTTALVLWAHDKLTLCWGGAAPLPDKVCVDELAALLVKLMIPDAVPESCGANVTVKGTLRPARIVTGKAIPVMVNSLLLIVADDTFTFAPLALSVAGRLADAPTVTVPKLMLAGDTVNCREAVPPRCELALLSELDSWAAARGDPVVTA
jgi:hypothetical protein